jgi:hypothetical protein
MDPMTIAALVSAAASAGSKAYGAYQSDKQASAQESYNRNRDALADKRQAEQDWIARQIRNRQMLLQTLERARQQRQEAASQWLPSMSLRGV